MQQISQLHRAATWYARHGYHVFPLIPGKKKPVTTNGFKNATTDLSMIDKWWFRNPNYNVGIACGASGLVVIDFDTYKSGVATDILFDDDDLVNTIISYTPHGGTHVWFKQPQDIMLTCSREGLPKDVDIRANGGYIVAPPSVLSGEGVYKFKEDHRPSDAAGVALPVGIVALLRQEPRVPQAPRTHRTASEREIADALGYLPERMSYDEWLSILMAVHSILPDERGIQLCEDWSPGFPGEIAKKFDSFKNSGKTIATLFHLAKQYGYRPPPPQPDEGVRAELFRLRGWVWSASCTRVLKERGIRRTTELISVLDALLVLGHERGSKRVLVTHRTIADICDIAPMTAWRRISKLKETNMLDVEKGDNGTIIDLSPVGRIVSDTDTTIGDTVSLTIQEMEWQAAHRTDDAFTSYPYWSAVKRRGGVAPLMASLGATGWLLWPHLRRGGTLDELVEATGLSMSAIKHSVKKYMACGLIEEDTVDKQGFYQLAADCENKLDDARPHMVTCGVGQMRMGRNHAETADYAAFRLRQRKKMESGDIRFWEEVRLVNDRRAATYFDHLKSQGFDACMKVGKEKPVRQRNRIDYGEEWRTWGRPLFDAYQSLGDQPMEQKVRLLTISRVGQDADAKTFRAVHKELEEKVDMMLMMAPKRAQFEKTGLDYYEAPVKLSYQQLALELEEVPHG